MGATWISCRTTVTAVITVLQIKAVISVRTTLLAGVEGQTFYFRCEYPGSLQSNAKYLCHADNIDDHLIWTDKHNQWETDGRYSLYDNTTAAFFIVRVDKLVPYDSGTYLCGVDISLHPDHINVIRLNVSRVSISVKMLLYAHNVLVEVTTNFPNDLTVDKLNMPLFLTAVMCVAAMLFVCLFALCLLQADNSQRANPRVNRETSSDYETMMPGVVTEPELFCTCSAPDCPDRPTLPAPPPDLCSHFTSQQRESAISYVNVDVPGHMCHYQHLDLSHSEDHVYHRLQRNCVDEPLGIKEKSNS